MDFISFVNSQYEELIITILGNLQDEESHLSLYFII